MFQINHSLITTHRKEHNYHIISNNDAENNDCYIYFSSNGLYFPNTPDEFTKKIIHQDRYEWQKTYNAQAKKSIFLRDIYKQWYIQGINDSLVSIEAVKDFLLKETKGYNIHCVGSSAGGYAALLFGYLLQAKTIYSFAPQLNLYTNLQETTRAQNPLLEKYQHDPAYKKYYDISWIFNQKDFPSHVIYLYPMHSAIDQEQFAYLNPTKETLIIPIKSAIHGPGVPPPVCAKIISIPSQKLIHFAKSPQNPVSISIKLIGSIKFSLYIFQKLKKRLLR